MAERYLGVELLRRDLEHLRSSVNFCAHLPPAEEASASSAFIMECPKRWSTVVNMVHCVESGADVGNASFGIAIVHPFYVANAPQPLQVARPLTRTDG